MIDVSRYVERVSGPGKFEGERAATAYFYDAMLSGDGESLCFVGEDFEYMYSATLFNVTAEEAEAFGLAPNSVYMIYEDDYGFVYGWACTNAEEAAADFARWLGIEG